MPGLTLNWTLGLGLPALLLQASTIAVSRALRTYSRSRLEELCEAKGRPDIEVAIGRDDEWTERSAESLSLVGGLVLSGLVGAQFAAEPHNSGTELIGLVILLAAILGHVASAAFGRVFAEPLLAYITLRHEYFKISF